MNFEERAERIIAMEGLTFALAVANIARNDPSASKRRSDVREARNMLKMAIAKALAECSNDVKGKTE